MDKRDKIPLQSNCQPDTINLTTQYNEEEDVPHLYRWGVAHRITGGEHISPASLKR